MNHVAHIDDEGVLHVRDRNGGIEDLGTAPESHERLATLDPDRFDVDAVRRDFEDQLNRIQQEEFVAEERAELDAEAGAYDHAALAEHWLPFVAGGKSLMDADTDSPIEWVPGAEGILRRRERQSWVAGYGEGKTQALAHFVVQVVEAGGRVIHVDAENDDREVAERIKPIVEAWGVDGFRERHAYHDDAHMLLSADRAKPLLGALPHADLLVIDSLSRVLSLMGYDENSNPDVLKFMTNVVDVIAKDLGVAVLILDNTGKSGSDARGAVSKAATVEAVYKVSGGKAVSEKQHGTIKLKLVRSRSGKLARFVQAGSGGGEWERLMPAEGAGDEPREDAKVMARRLAVKQYLFDRRGQAFSEVQLGEVVDVSAKTVGRDMDELQKQGTVVLEKRGNKKYWSAVAS